MNLKEFNTWLAENAIYAAGQKEYAEDNCDEREYQYWTGYHDAISCVMKKVEEK